MNSSFRIFTMDPANALSRDTWTAVGPASIQGRSGRVGGIAVDPSDPTGNTVYIGGASGGIWKTTNFLTTNPLGPTYIPLTDFGVTFGINIGGIAVYPRNNDTNQSIIVASTGEGDTGTPGVGFLISKDGGATWNLYDSTVNVDANGNLLPINSPLRDRKFVGATSFKVVVDPSSDARRRRDHLRGLERQQRRDLAKPRHRRALAAHADRPGDRWFSLDPAQLTHGGSGNLQFVYAGIPGRGRLLQPQPGAAVEPDGRGRRQSSDPQHSSTTPTRIRSTNPITQRGPGPNRPGQARATGNAAPGPDLPGLALRRGRHPQRQLLRSLRDQGLRPELDPGSPREYPRPSSRVARSTRPSPPTTSASPIIRSSAAVGSLPAQGNYDITLTIDPTNPNIVYLGGGRRRRHLASSASTPPTSGMPTTLVAYANIANDGGTLNLASTGPATVTSLRTAPSFVNPNPGFR